MVGKIASLQDGKHAPYQFCSKRRRNGKPGAPSCQQGPRGWLCQTAGAAAPSGGRELHEVSDRGGHVQPILQPAPESASAFAATPITLFSLFSTTRRYMSCTGLCEGLMVHLPRGLSITAPSRAL